MTEAVEVQGMRRTGETYGERPVLAWNRSDLPVWELPVHRAAQVLPMLPDAEMEDFTASICRVGLLNPIAVLGDGTVIDGKIRLEGCRRASVEPRFVWAGAYDLLVRCWRIRDLASSRPTSALDGGQSRTRC
jgi:hypothetical protein